MVHAFHGLSLMSETGRTGVEDLPRVLILDERRPLREALAAALRSRGYAIECADTDGQIFDAIRKWKPNLLLVDLSLNDRMGIAVFKHFRDEKFPPVIVMAKSGDEAQVLSALQSGASDFVMRPIDLEIVTTRINAALMAMHSPRQENASEVEVIRSGPVVIYPPRRAVFIRAREVHLPRLEYDLLYLLVADPGRVRTREEILRKIWGERTTDTRTLNTHIQRLRAKIEVDRSRPRHVMTMRNIGYYFAG